MSEVLWRIEAIDVAGRSLGAADIITFKLVPQRRDVVSFEAVWPMHAGDRMVRVNEVRIEGKAMELETSIVISPGDVLRIGGLCSARWAQMEGRLDG